MINNRITLVAVIFIVLALSLACSLTGGAPIGPGASQESDSQVVIATSVAATLDAGQVDTPTATISPADTEETLPPVQPNYETSGISLYLSGQLAENITAIIVPANLCEANSFWNTPEHREFQFHGWALKKEVYHQPVLRIYRIADFEAVNPIMADRISGLQTTLAAQPVDGSGLAIPDQFNAGQLFQSNIRYLDFQNGSGARWLSQYGQALFPIGLPYLFYTFQGLTNDGRYYISLILPVDQPALPPVENVTLDEAFFNNYDNYASETRVLLESQPASSFIPSLELLDQLVGSLAVGE